LRSNVSLRTQHQTNIEERLRRTRITWIESMSAKMIDNDDPSKARQTRG
jgi:hypothetical protein